MKIKDLKIGTQLKIAFSILLLLVIALSFTSYFQLARMHKQVEQMHDYPLQVRRTIGELNASVYRIRLAERDLYLAQKQEEKMPIRQTMNLADENIKLQIDILKTRYLGPKNHIDDLHNAYIRWKTVREGITDFLDAAEARDLTSFNAMISPTGIAGQAREEMRQNIDSISVYAYNKADELMLTSDAIKSTMFLQLVLLSAIVIVLILVLIQFLLRGIRNPIEEFTRAAAQFSEGDMEARIAFQSANELGKLSAVFNNMAESIQVNSDITGKAAILTGKMLTEDDARKFFHETLQLFMKHTNSQMAAVYLLDDNKTRFEHFESIGIQGAARESFLLNGLEGEFGAAISTQKVQHLKEIPDTTRFIFSTPGGSFVPREIITIPIIAGGEPIAVVSLASVYSYGEIALELIKRIHITYAARIQGILAYRQIKEILVKLQEQNSELEIQQRELTAQSSELTEQNRELEVQKNQLSEANKLKTSFLSNMSHELRTPLNSVIALSGVLSRRLAKQIPGEELSYLEVIERNGKNLLSLINDILDISRIESGMEEIEPMQFDLCAAINDVASMIQPQAAEKNLSLNNAVGDCKVQIITDATKFRHILQNLIGNAVKFTENGGVSISVKKLDDKVAIIVSDTGIGISAENLPHIFDKFRQADSSVSRRFGGTGLGLAIAKKYANLLGGSVMVKSVQGEGSEFTLTLPLVYDENYQVTENSTDDGSITKTIPKPENSTVSGGTKTVMLVEDSEPAVIQIKDFLEENGYKVVVGKGGAEALELFKTIIPDAIILDLMMPGIDGFQLLQSIRDADITAHIPVLILTAKYITKEDLRFLKRNKVYQLIQKGDINRHELVKVVGEMIVGKTVETKKPVKEKQPITGKPKVLVVEDNPDNMITVKALLAGKYTVIEAVNGREGVEKAKAHLPDLILMDIALPEMDGIQAFKAIRSDGRLQHTPIIALTASALNEDRELVLAHGFNAFIAKPIDESFFFKTINETLYGK